MNTFKGCPDTWEAYLEIIQEYQSWLYESQEDLSLNFMWVDPKEAMRMYMAHFKKIRQYPLEIKF